MFLYSLHISLGIFQFIFYKQVPQETSAFVTVRVSEGNGQGYYENTVVNSGGNFFDYSGQNPVRNNHEKTKYFTSQGTIFTLLFEIYCEHFKGLRLQT